MAWRRPTGGAGRGPTDRRGRKIDHTDFELQTHAVCGRVLPEKMIEELKMPGPKSPPPPGRPPGPTAPPKNPPFPPNPPFTG